MRLSDGWKRLGSMLDAALGFVGAVVLFCMMALTFVDVVMRYVFAAPVRGAFEITELMMMILIYAGLPLVSRHNAHVTTDLIDRFLSRSVKRVLAVVIQAVCAISLFGASWLIWVKARQTAAYDDTTASLQITLTPFVYLMFFLLFITAVIHVLKSLYGGTLGGDDDGEAAGPGGAL